jgi:hypothetical protein
MRKAAPPARWLRALGGAAGEELGQDFGCRPSDAEEKRSGTVTFIAWSVMLEMNSPMPICAFVKSAHPSEKSSAAADSYSADGNQKRKLNPADFRIAVLSFEAALELAPTQN